MPREKSEYSLLLSRWFGQGADDRLAGKPLSSNPYRPLTAAYFQYRKGWIFCNAHWAELDNAIPGELPPITDENHEDHGKRNGSPLAG